MYESTNIALKVRMPSYWNLFYQNKYHHRFSSFKIQVVFLTNNHISIQFLSWKKVSPTSVEVWTKIMSWHELFAAQNTNLLKRMRLEVADWERKVCRTKESTHHCEHRNHQEIALGRVENIHSSELVPPAHNHRRCIPSAANEEEWEGKKDGGQKKGGLLPFEFVDRSPEDVSEFLKNGSGRKRCLKVFCSSTERERSTFYLF